MKENKKKIRWGILGAGPIADKFLSDLQTLDSAVAVAIVSSTPEKAIHLSSKYQIEQIFSDYETFAQSDEFDAVYVATAHNFHAEHATLCLKNGKHVLCEKPITVNAQQLALLQQLAHEKGVLLMEAMWSYFLPAFLKAKEWINEGLLGEVKQIHAQFGFKAPFLPEKRIFNPQLAGGALLDVGIYPLAFALYFAGAEITHVDSKLAMGSTGVDEHNAVLMHFNNGVSALLSSSVTIQMENAGVIYGSKGRIVMPEFWKTKKAILETESERLIFEDKRSTWGYDFETDHFNELLLNGKTESPVVSYAVSMRLMELMDSVRAANGLKYPFE